MLNGRLKPYLACSAAAHAGLILLLVLVLPDASSQPAATYHIISLQASPGIINRSPAAEMRAADRGAAAKVKATPPRAKAAPQKSPDIFDTQDRPKGKPLPRPSFLSGDTPAPKDEPAPVKEAPPAAAEKPAAPASSDGSSLSAPGEADSLTALDMPDFPYPWYVTQLRSAIWERWTSRIFTGSGNCVVRFTILKNGRAVDIRVEFTSGDKSFDLASLNAVRDSAPFPPLPPRYKDSFLNVHFEFKAQ